MPWMDGRAQEVLFSGGSVWDPARWPTPVVGDLLVTAGRIAAVGVDLPVPVGARQVDLEGGTLLPAFADGHAHPLQAGLEAQSIPVRDRDLAGVLEGVRQWAAGHLGVEWLYGGGFDPALTPDGVFDAHWLDAAVADRPVVLQASDYHTLWCNSLALRRAGITTDTPEPPDGHIVRRSDGSPIGTLREWGATAPVLAALPAPDRASKLAALAEATARCAATGLSWVQDAWVEPDDIPAYLAAAGAGMLAVGVNLALRADPAGWRGQVAEFAALRAQVEAAGHRRLTARTVKFFVDGVIESGTAALLSPYLDCPHSSGIPHWAGDELVAAVAAFSAAGFQVHLHAIGDAAVRETVDAIQASRSVIEQGDLRPVIAHLQLIDPVDLPRLAELGVIGCFQPLWAQPDPSQEVLTAPRLGPDRTARQYPIKAVLDSGAVVSFGSDWPVTDLAPLPGLVTAVTRQTPAGQPPGGWVPEQRLDLRSALTAYTAGAARQGFRDDAGTLAVGAVADLVWLGADLTGDPVGLRDAPVRGTWLAGARTH